MIVVTEMECVYCMVWPEKQWVRLVSVI